MNYFKSFFILIAVFPTIAYGQHKLTIDEFSPDAKIEFGADTFDRLGCRTLSETSLSCENAFSHILGARPKASKLTLQKSRIVRLYFSGEQSEFSLVSAALQRKLGKPSRTTTLNLSRQSSEKAISSLKQTWYFSEGSVTLTERSYLSDNFSFQYHKN